MNNKHFSFVVEFLNFVPSEMMRSLRPLKGEDACMTEAQVKRNTSVVLQNKNESAFLIKKQC